jgi:TetR/AcrR family tetracycline transcriptional repressor
VLEEQSAQAPDAPPSSTLNGPDAAQYPLLAAGWAQTVGDDAALLFDRALRLLIDGAQTQLPGARGRH